MLVGAGSSLGKVVGTGSLGSSDATTVMDGWLKTKEAKRIMEIISEVKRKNLREAEVFILFLL